MADFGRLMVDPDELVQRAEKAFSDIRACEEALSTITNAVRAGETFWRGESGELVREVYARESARSLSAIEGLVRYPKDLLEYNGLYSAVIQTTESTVDAIDTYSLE